MGKNKALTHHTSTYFHTRMKIRGSVVSFVNLFFLHPPEHMKKKRKDTEFHAFVCFGVPTISLHGSISKTIQRSSYLV